MTASYINGLKVVNLHSKWMINHLVESESVMADFPINPLSVKDSHIITLATAITIQ